MIFWDGRQTSLATLCNLFAKVYNDLLSIESVARHWHGRGGLGAGLQWSLLDCSDTSGVLCTQNQSLSIAT